MPFSALGAYQVIKGMIKEQEKKINSLEKILLKMEKDIEEIKKKMGA